MDEKELPDEQPERVASTRPQQGGFFSIYKKGQGYWTRMGTALGAALLLTVFAVFAYTQLKVYLPEWIHTSVPTEGMDAVAAKAETDAQIAAKQTANSVAAGVTVGLVIVGAIVAWRLMNKPSNADFLIATDVEMKKVNWTSRAELFGSTRIVIIFVFLIALILFLVDVGTGMFFQLIGLLKFGPLS